MNERVKSFMQKSKRTIGKAVGVAAGFAMTAATAITAHAEDGVNDGVSAARTLMGELTRTLNISNAVAIITAGIGAVLGLFLAWWGARKLGNMVITVFRKGKIKF